MLVGLSALQGSGKSTFAAQIVAAAKARGLEVLSVSLDDFYHGRNQRRQLARSVHPLLATRGVPGTHEIELIERTLDALANASSEVPARVPRFDKGRDTRMAPSRWRRITRAPQLILLEGWCVGVGAQTDAELANPINALERDEDADLRWRRHVNAQLAGDYARLWRRLDRLVVLQAPDFDVVSRWRNEQEEALRSRNAVQAMSPAAIDRFIQHYERLSRHALRTLPVCADFVIGLGERREVLGISAIAPHAASSARTARC